MLAVCAGARRSIARAWNGCIGVIEGWPERRLIEPAIKTTEEPEWEKFPEGLRRDIEDHISGLTRRRRDARGNRLEPCKPSTIRTRSAELKAAARIAIREGVPIGSLFSLAALVHPDVAELVIDAYWKADGPEPRIYTIDLGWKLLSIARSIGCLDDVAMERLDDMRASLETHRRGGLTEKNMILVRQVISGDVWRRVINLPEALMAQARLLSDQSPVKKGAGRYLMGTFLRAPTISPQMSGPKKEQTRSKHTKNADFSKMLVYGTSFGTRGSQVQILPLRPVLS
jgi:hypothetical protein